MSMALGHAAHHYERLNLTKNVIHAREDALRTNAGVGSFEWWYLDTHLDDGTKMVITFYTKPPQVSAARPLMPFVSFLLDSPDGTHIERGYLASPEAFTASTEACDVRIGNNTFSGDLKTYVAHVEIDDVVVDLALTAQLPPWRPATGHVFFGEKEEQFVAWFPAVPQGHVAGELSIGGKKRTFTGSAYHDHNWGNVSLSKVIDHWYWARARVGEYMVVALMFRGSRAFGGDVITSFMLAKGDAVIATDENKLRFSTSEPAIHQETGIAYHGKLTYELPVGDETYRVSFSKEQDLYTVNFAPVGAYMRFGGTATLERTRQGKVVESAAAEAIWELLHFNERPSVREGSP